MFNSAFTFVRDASRMQARSLTRTSARCARGVTASVAPRRHEKGWDGSHRSNRSRGQGPRFNSHPPLRLTAVAGFSILAVLANSDSPEPSPPNYAFKDPSGWKYFDANPSLFLDIGMRYIQAIKTNSIEEARRAQFDLTRSQLEFCVRGDIIDEGSLPSDVVFGLGQYVAKEDTRVFWMPSKIQGTDPIICLSVHYHLKDHGMCADFLDGALGATMCRRLLEKFKEHSGTHIFVHVHSSGQFYQIPIPRDDIASALEHIDSLLTIQE